MTQTSTFQHDSQDVPHSEKSSAPPSSHSLSSPPPTMAFLTSLPTILTSSIVFISFALSIHSHVKQNGPVPLARRLMRLSNVFYSIFSLVFCIAIVSSLWRHVGGNNTTISWFQVGDDTLRFAFHLSKLYEYLDIFFVLGSGSPVSIHFAFHHLTTPYLTYARTIRSPAYWQPFVILNTFHHSLMYAYFGGLSKFSRLLPYTGYLQLIVGILVEVASIFVHWDGPDAVWPNVFAASLFSCYAVLFAGDLREAGKAVGEKVE
ncbi:hypothetical protein JAAARDRAFT_42824 [Jaapia argillacea MUCL 33604]|uniref:Elongation of fatty acids protein n=1 Tax=Jaapia argillacea MUCL 33604 TaxID=933084 RepID=A0A067P3M9_9AGAM|nr:hypothetical protein JAAARDRAFT_42824 [Jaapia argillacea MUCL 33604]